MVKKILKEDFLGNRRRGLPRTGWMRDVEEDLGKLEVTVLRTKARDRDVCSKIVKEAIVHLEL